MAERRISIAAALARPAAMARNAASMGTARVALAKQEYVRRHRRLAPRAPVIIVAKHNSGRIRVTCTTAKMVAIPFPVHAMGKDAK